MSLAQHLGALCDLTVAWEAELHERLGYLPLRFQTCCRSHLDAYLRTIEEELLAELERVRAARGRLRVISPTPQSVAAARCATENV